MKWVISNLWLTSNEFLMAISPSKEANWKKSCFEHSNGSKLASLSEVVKELTVVGILIVIIWWNFDEQRREFAKKQFLWVVFPNVSWFLHKASGLNYKFKIVRLYDTAQSERKGRALSGAKFQVQRLDTSAAGYLNAWKNEDCQILLLLNFLLMLCA